MPYWALLYQRYHEVDIALILLNKRAGHPAPSSSGSPPCCLIGATLLLKPHEPFDALQALLFATPLNLTYPHHAYQGPLPCPSRWYRSANWHCARTMERHHHRRAARGHQVEAFGMWGTRVQHRRAVCPGVVGAANCCAAVRRIALLSPVSALPRAGVTDKGACPLVSIPVPKCNPHPRPAAAQRVTSWAARRPT